MLLRVRSCERDDVYDNARQDLVASSPNNIYKKGISNAISKYVVIITECNSCFRHLRLFPLHHLLIYTDTGFNMALKMFKGTSAVVPFGVIENKFHHLCCWTH